MSREILKDRENALEYEFFHRVDQQLLEKLRAQLKSEECRTALAKFTGIDDEAVLQELVDLGIRSETVLALSLAPLVRVAWCDGAVNERERDAILDAARAMGHDRDEPGYRLLESWLDECPDEQVFAAWEDYVHALNKTISAASRGRLGGELLTRARRVAEAAGGVMGIHRVSRREQEVLGEIESVLGAPIEEA